MSSNPGFSDMRREYKQVDRTTYCQCQQCRDPQNTPDFGEILSIDGTVVKAYAKRNRGFLSTTDPDARLGYKEHRSGKPVFEFGYRFTIASDGRREIPITCITKPANANESRLFPAILKQVRNLGIQFEVLIADAQYDSRRNIWLTIAYGAKPIIPLNPRSSKTARQTGTRRADAILPIQRNSPDGNDTLQCAAPQNESTPR